MSRVRTRSGRAALGAVAALALTCAATVPAIAIVNTPPQFPMTALPGSEGMDATGYTAGEPLTVEVRRGPFVISTASGVARENAIGTGLIGIQVNQPPDVGATVCWKGITPDLVAGDYLRVVRQNGDADEMQIPDVGLTSNPTDAGSNQVTVTGFARAPLGGPLAIGGLTAQILKPKNDPDFSNGDRLITTDPALTLGGLAGVLAYDPAPGSVDWTATWNLPDADDKQKALLGGAGITFTGDTLTEITTVAASDLPGPDGTCPGPISFALPIPPVLDPSSDSGAADNVTTTNTLLVAGPTGRAAPGATVSLLVDGQVAATGTVGPERTYAISTPVLADGTHEIKMREVIAGFNRTSGPLTVTVDATAPAAPLLTTSPASGSDDNAPRVTGSAEAGSTVRLYSGPGCGGTAIATVPAAELGAPGVSVGVGDNTTSSYSATATDAVGHTSACSTPVSYAEITPPPTGQVSLLGKLATSNPAWRVRLKLTCSGPLGAVCYGRLNLTSRATTRTRSGRRIARNVLIGSKAFAVRAGLQSTIVVQVRRQARPLVTQRGRLTAQVQIVTQIGNGTTTVGRNTVTVVAPPR